MDSDPACRFCAQGEPGKRVLEEMPDFNLVADSYGLTEGHLLLIPKKHYACFGALPRELLGAFADVKSRVERFLQSEFQAPFYFEYGVAGQTIPHAHVHAVPGPAQILDIIMMGRYATSVQSWDQVQQYYRVMGAYLYFEQEGCAWVISGEAVPPGYIRSVASAALGVASRAEWRQAAPLPEGGLAHRWRGYWRQLAPQRHSR